MPIQFRLRSMADRWVRTAFVWIPSMVLWLGACRGGPVRPPLDPSDPAATAQRLSAYLAAHPNDQAAQRDLAHLRWIYLGESGAAIEALDALVRQGDPLARLSRMVIAQGRKEPELFQSLAFEAIRDANATAASADPLARLHDAVAEYAARGLEDGHGELEGDDERFEALMRSLEPLALSYSIAQPLMSLRAAIARKHGQPFRPLYARQGCVQQWEVGPMIGSRASIELERHPPGNFTPDPDAALVSLACVVRVWNPTASPGIRPLATAIKTSGGPIVLELGAAEPSRFYLDGALVHRTDTIDRYGPRRVRLQLWLAPGWHRLEVHTTIDAQSSWVLARAVASDGTALPVRRQAPASWASPFDGRMKPIRAPWPQAVPGIEGPIYAPLRAYLAVDHALAQGDSDRAERYIDRLTEVDAFALGHWMRARFEQADPSRGRTVSVARELDALARTLQLDPTLDAARLRLLQIQRQRGDDAEVEQAIAQLPPERLAGVDGELLRFWVFLAQGNEYRAEHALARAAQRNPQSCKVLMAERALARERANVSREDQIATKLDTCAGSLIVRARLAEARGRWDDARDRWLEVLDRTPDDLGAHENLARVQALRGDLAAARDHLQTSLRFNPFGVGSHLALADLAASEGNIQPARQQLRHALRTVPHSNALWNSAESLGLDDDLMQWRIDGASVLRDYRASDTTYEGVGEVLVLDRSVARVYANGGQRQMVHIVAHLLTKEALDKYGELSIPASAELLTLRTIKPDGRMLEPEIVPGKEGVSLRNLELDDVVEYEYIIQDGPVGAMPGYVDVSTFRFQSPDIPYHRSELVVVHPAAVKLRFDARNNPPVDQTSTVSAGDQTLQVHHFRADRVPRFGVEPGVQHWLEELPSVHVYTALDVPRYLDSLAAQIRVGQRRNPALRSLVSRLTRGLTVPRDRLEVLWAWVVDNVEDSGDLSVPATVTFAARTGSRLMLLRAMLREAGLDAELWLARDRFGPRPLSSGHPLVEFYETAMLAVPLPDAPEPVMVMTASKVMPPGYLAPAYRNTDGLRIQLEPHEAASGPVRLPDLAPGFEDRRTWNLQFELDRQGAGTVRGTMTLHGMEAVMWRQALRQIDRDRIREVFQQAELGWLPGASLVNLTIDDEDALDRPLQLRFMARTSGAGITQDQTLVLRALPMPMNLGAPFAVLPRRTTGLLVPYAPRLEVTARYRLIDARFESIPRPQTIQTPAGSFSVKVVDGGVGSSAMTLRAQSSLETGIIPPSRYAAWASFVREVDAAVQDVLRAR